MTRAAPARALPGALAAGPRAGARAPTGEPRSNP